MRIIGVIDLLDGVAVHAVGGMRERYEAVAGVHGDPLALARSYTEMGVDELYAADLDAIRGTGANDAIASGIAEACRALWLDAGVSSVGRARKVVVTSRTFSSKSRSWVSR